MINLQKDYPNKSVLKYLAIAIFALTAFPKTVYAAPDAEIGALLMLPNIGMLMILLNLGMGILAYLAIKKAFTNSFSVSLAKCVGYTCTILFINIILAQLLSGSTVTSTALSNYISQFSFISLQLNKFNKEIIHWLVPMGSIFSLSIFPAILAMIILIVESFLFATPFNFIASKVFFNKEASTDNKKLLLFSIIPMFFMWNAYILFWISPLFDRLI